MSGIGEIESHKGGMDMIECLKGGMDVEHWHAALRWCSLKLASHPNQQCPVLCVFIVLVFVLYLYLYIFLSCNIGN